MNSQRKLPLLIARLLFLIALGLSFKALAFEKPQLAQDDRIRLAEAFRVGEKLGDKVWKGWSKAPFAVLLVTPEYEFLVRHPQPTKDFTALGYDPLLKSEIYFRKRVFQPNLLATFPAVGGVSTIVVGQPANTDTKSSTRWVITLLHEHFHQMQDSQPDFYAQVNALELTHGDQTGMWMLNFPFPYEKMEVNQQFALLKSALAEAIRSGKKDFPGKLAAYLDARKSFQAMLAPDEYKYFSFQLWKEGAARYTEYRIARAAVAAGYKPGKEFAALKDFSSFQDTAEAILSRILNDLQNMSLSERQRTAFYSLGAGEALLLDRANPKWQGRYFTEKFFLDRFFKQFSSRA